MGTSRPPEPNQGGQWHCLGGLLVVADVQLRFAQVSSAPSGKFVAISQLFPDSSRAFLLDFASDLDYCERVLLRRSS